LLGIDTNAARYTWTAAVVLLMFGVIYLIREALFIFVIALLFAYLLYPLMDLIDRHLTAKTRTPALAITFLLVLGILSVLGTYVGSAVAQQAGNLTRQLPGVLNKLQQSPSPQEPGAVGSLKTEVMSTISSQLREHTAQIAGYISEIGLRVLAASRNLIYVVIVPILSFLILKDGRKILNSLLDALDTGREAAKDILADVHELLLVYMRALLVLCCATFFCYSIILSAMGEPYALLLASIAFPLEFIPLIGPLAAALIIIGVSLFSGYAHPLWIVIFLGVYRVFQDYVLSPNLMSRGVELHPLLVIFGIIAGGDLGGIPGIFLSVPVLALIRLFYHRLKKGQAARRVRAIA